MTEKKEDRKQTPESFGEILRNFRKESGVSLEQISVLTKVNKGQLLAMEEGRWDLLPAPVFIRGFVKLYAKAIGKEPDELLNLFDQISIEKEYEEHKEATKTKEKEKNKKGYLLLIVALFVVIIVSLMWLSSHRKRSTIFISKKNEESKINTTSTSSIITTTTTSTTTTIEEAKEEKGIKLVIKAKEYTWIGISVDGEKQKGLFLHEGDVITKTAKNSIELKVGNAGGIDIEYNGKELGSPGKRGEVKKLIFPPVKKEDKKEENL
ncbi:MAG: hypothetical protein DRP55_00495 [Spirochaetes bacterium]|nr:DUF4115 domain-containing protein [Deltaproteobacteria bacterium]RKY03828.1 MAG: hypothetical protein DRP55_00495 [Spirochaetota bacterium]